MNKKLPHKQAHWQSLRYWLEFLLALTEKEIKARYKHAVFGFLWMILNPVLQMLVIGFVFQFFMPIKMDNYFLFLFSGLLPWNFFSMSLIKTVQVFYYERSLIQKAKFPVESLLLSIILSNMFHKIVSIAIFLLVLVVLGLFSVKWLLLIPLLAWSLAVTIGFCLIFATWHVKYRDVAFFIEAAMPLWFYVTPVIYSIDLVPERLRPIFYLNPMTALIESFRFVLVNGQGPGLGVLLLSVLMSCLILAAGILIFNKESRYFDDWL